MLQQFIYVTKAEYHNGGAKLNSKPIAPVKVWRGKCSNAIFFVKQNIISDINIKKLT